jgi:hypothetical protein
MSFKGMSLADIGISIFLGGSFLLVAVYMVYSVVRSVKRKDFRLLVMLIIAFMIAGIAEYRVYNG